MITPGLEEKQDTLGSRYDMVILAAERAKQIQQGASPLLRTTSTHPLTIALEEITAGLYPQAPKEAPTDLDESFITDALADQDLTDIQSRFESLTAGLTLDTPATTTDDTEENEE